MTPFRILSVGLLGVALMLYALNPGPEAFERFLRIDTAERAEAAAHGGADISGGMGTFLANRVGREIGGEATHVFDRDDYYVASVYRIDLDPARPGGDWAFLGIANWFVPIEQPEPSAGV